MLDVRPLVGEDAVHDRIADRAIAPRKDVIGRHVSIFPADVIARVVPGKIRIDFVPRPTARFLCGDQPFDRRARHKDEGDASFDSRPPLPGAPLLRRVKLPPPLSLRGDIVKVLLKERQNDR